MSEPLTRADFLNDIIRATNQDYEAVRRIKANDATLRAELDISLRVQEQLAENVNAGLLEMRALKAELATVTAGRDKVCENMTACQELLDYAQGELTRVRQQLAEKTTENADLKAQWHFAATHDASIDDVEEVRILRGKLALMTAERDRVAATQVIPCLPIHAVEIEALQQQLASSNRCAHEQTALYVQELNAHGEALLRIALLRAELVEKDAELAQWRTCGVTEELLRRHDGYIKLGNGCSIVRSEEYAELKQQRKD